MDTDAPLVQLGNQSFVIGFDMVDDARRKNYFRDGSGQLTESEKNLLISLGFDAELEKALAPDMAKFFMDLQKCPTDASIHLRKECELPYYILWSALFHDQKETRRRLDDNLKKEKGLSDIDSAMIGALVQGLRPTEADVILQLFSLILLPERTTLVESRAEIINKVFSLMLLPPRSKTAE